MSLSGSTAAIVAASALAIVAASTIAPLSRPGWQANFNDDLVGRERRRECALKEVRGLDCAEARLAHNHDLGFAGHRKARHFSGRIRMSDAATDSAAIPDLVMRHVCDR